MLDAKLHELKKSLDLTQERTIKIAGRLKLSIEQLVQLLKITGVLPEEAEDPAVYYENQDLCLQDNPFLEIHWGYEEEV